MGKKILTFVAFHPKTFKLSASPIIFAIPAFETSLLMIFPANAICSRINEKSPVAPEYFLCSSKINLT